MSQNLHRLLGNSTGALLTRPFCRKDSGVKRKAFGNIDAKESAVDGEITLKILKDTTLLPSHMFL